MTKKESVCLYEREVPFYLEKIKKFSLVLHKKVIVSYFSDVHDYSFYLVKKKSCYHVYTLNVVIGHSVNTKRKLFLYKSFIPEKDPIQAIFSFRELASQEFFNKHMPRSNYTVRSTRYTAYSGKDVI